MDQWYVEHIDSGLIDGYYCGKDEEKEIAMLNIWEQRTGSKCRIVYVKKELAVYIPDCMMLNRVYSPC